MEATASASDQIALGYVRPNLSQIVATRAAFDLLTADFVNPAPAWSRKELRT